MKARKVKYYVSMKDEFMSGWGRAEDKINILVFECKDIEEARIVADNAKSRTDMFAVKIQEAMPKLNEEHYFVQVKDIEEYPRWYEEGFFKRG